MEIWIDDREKAISCFVKESNDNLSTTNNVSNKNVKENINIIVKRINIGDYILLLDNIIKVVVERKTLKDLASSMLDGRKENIKKLIELRNQTQCKIVYIIEGNIPNYERKINHIPYKNMLAHLDHLMIRDDVFIIHSKNPEDTLERLKLLIKNISTIKTNENSHSENSHSENSHSENSHSENLHSENSHSENSHSENLHSEKGGNLETNKLTNNELVNQKIVVIKPEIKFLAKIPGISNAMAEILHNQNITINMIYNSYDFSNIKYPSGRPFNSKKIKINDLPKKNIKNILKEIPTVGEFKANLLVDEFYKLLNKEHDISSLALSGISESSANIILKYFS